METRQTGDETSSIYKIDIAAKGEGQYLDQVGVLSKDLIYDFSESLLKLRKPEGLSILKDGQTLVVIEEAKQDAKYLNLHLVKLKESLWVWSWQEKAVVVILVFISIIVFLFILKVIKDLFNGKRETSSS